MERRHGRDGGGEGGLEKLGGCYPKRRGDIMMQPTAAGLLGLNAGDGNQVDDVRGSDSSTGGLSLSVTLTIQLPDQPASIPPELELQR